LSYYAQAEFLDCAAGFPQTPVAAGSRVAKRKFPSRLREIPLHGVLMSFVRTIVRRVVLFSCLVLLSTSVSAFAQSAPTCSLTANPMNGQAPLRVSFTVACTDPNQNFLSGQIVFGDGGFSNFSTLTPPPISHVYYRAGSVQATVFGSYVTTQSAPSSETITVTPFVPTGPSTIGDIFVSGDNGAIEAHKPDGTLSNILTVPRTDFLGGMAFDANRRLFASDRSGGDDSSVPNVWSFDQSGNPKTFTNDLATTSINSLAFDKNGTAYIGGQSTLVSGAAAIIAVSSSGIQTPVFSAASDQTQGFFIEFLDLAGDQCTVYYTLGTASIKRFNVCTNQQQQDFNLTALAGSNAEEIRIRPNGEVLVADGASVIRLDAKGNQTQTYGSTLRVSFYSLALDPDGTSFWTGDKSGTVYRFDIDSGKLLTQFSTQLGTTDGISLFGEIRAAANPGPSCTLAVTPTSGSVPLTVNANGSCTNSSLNTLDFGDGTPVEQDTSSDSHTYVNSGTFVVKFTGVDPGGTKNVATQVVTVNQPPTCSLSITPTSGFAALTVNVNASCLDTDGFVSSASIDWGDATPTTQLNCDGNCSFNGTHTYNAANTYLATLSAKDNAGATSQPVEQDIVVNPNISVSTVQISDKQRTDGQTRPLQITLSNVSKTATVNFTGQATTSNPAYTVSTDCKSLAPGASCSVFASFKASAACELQGTNITLPNDDPGGSPTINITGYGADSGFQLDDLTNSKLTAQALVNAIVGQGVVTSNVTYTGAPLSAGTFSSSSSIVGFNNGIVLSSGSVRNLAGPNCIPNMTVDHSLPGDSDLDTLAGQGNKTADASVLEFDFVPNGSVLTFQYVFSSEEYNEFVSSPFNDTFGFFVNGQNVALIPGTATPVAINNVNAGQSNRGVAPPGAPNSKFFINNDFDSPNAPVDTEMDGLTVVMTAQAQVNPGKTNHIKLAIADASDGILDSNVFIQGGSFTSQQVTIAPLTIAFGNQAVGTTSAAQTVTFTNNGATPVTISGITAPNGFSQTNTCPSTLAPVGQTGSSCTISVTFNPISNVNYSGNLIIADNAAGNPHTVSLSGTGTGTPQGPLCNLSVNPNSGVAPLPITATGSCTAGTAPISSTSLDFGDGSQAQNGSSGTHTYNAGGTFTVKVTAIDANGLSGSATQTVTVRINTAPTCTLTVSPTSGIVPLPVTATGNCVDAENNISTTVLDFGDGTTANGASGTHTYNAAGTFNVKVTATDALGLSGSASQTVTVTVNNFPQGLFVGVSSGTIKRFASDGTLTQTLTTGLNGTVSGMGFDKAGNLYATDFTAGNVSRFDPKTGALLGTFGTGFNCQPETIVFDGAGNAYVGQQGCSRQILKFDPSGKLVTTFTVATEEQGSDDIDLSADNCTLLYTSEGPSILRYDVCRNQQLPPFATGLKKALMLRILPDGGVIVGDLTDIVRLNATGQQVMTYTAPGDQCLYSITLDQDGTSFWAGDYCSSNIYRFDINSGKQLAKFNSGTPSGTVFGVAISGSGLNVAGLGNAGTVATSPASATLASGQSATFTVSFTANAASAGHTLTLSCASLPAGLGCSFNPSTITLGAAGTTTTSTLTITRTITATLLHPSSPWMLASWMGIVPAIVLVGLRSPRRGRSSMMWVAMIVACTGIWAGCGGGGGSMSQSTPPTPTPHGTYTVIVVGSSGGMQASTTVNLTVQ